MLKRNFLIAILFVLTAQGYSQSCVPGNYTTPGVYPDTITNLPKAVATISYNEAITFVIQNDTTIPPGITLTVDSLGITGVTGLPQGFIYSPNTSTSYWHGGATGCVLFSGNPTQAQVGIYPLTFEIKLYISGISAIDTIFGYKIEILDSAFASCNDTVSANAIDTCFSFVPDTAYIYSYNYISSDSVSVTWAVFSQNNTQQVFATVTYLTDSSACFVVVLSINCTKSSIYQFYDRLYIENVTVGINQLNAINNNGYDLFPNPATDKITIEIPEKSEIEILNIEGRIIKSIISDGNHICIDVSGYAKGMYFVKAKTKNEIIVKKFLKE
jgi:hypothetical protein